ncbi:uncharacterized protein [Ptychodera flava]|uniref:uncharacterized protein n=1 Tax=Ptychodera flava TaxID=63121 RepID=UPI003969BCCC
MATLYEVFTDGVVVQDTSLCAICSVVTVTGDRYRLITKNGLRKPLLEDFEAIFSVTFSRNIRNYDSYVCKPCRRKIASWKSHIRAASDIKDDLLKIAKPVETSVTVKRERTWDYDDTEHYTVCEDYITPIEKRMKVTETSPESPSNSTCSSPRSETSSPSKAEADSNSIKGPIHVSTRRTQIIEFYSTSTAIKTSDIISSLCKGSIRKATRKLLSKECLQKKSIQGLADVIRSESKKYRTLHHLKSDDFDFNSEDAVEEIKQSLPLLWTALSSGCPKSTPISKILMTACIIVHARDRNMNALQHLIGKMMYQSGLRREGYNFLTGFGMQQGSPGTMANQEQQPTVREDHTYAIRG